ncbi:MAG: hypothetical protein HKM95_01915 [Inquilinus sp.]|nr:hypothetical protein [Inquilinus sp.]
MATDLPIIPHYVTELDHGEQRRVAHLADRILADEPAMSSTTAFGTGVTTGIGPWPGLVLEDHSGISLFDRANGTKYSQRALLLAGDGDFVAIRGRRYREFERYCRDTLALGDVTVLVPRPATRTAPLSIGCAEDAAVRDRLERHARLNGGLNIVPYMGTGGVWRLAATLAGRTGRPVKVAAPPPRLARRVNDKFWFARCAAALLGGGALPPTHAVFGPAALAGRIANLAKRQAAIAVKVTDSASALGTVLLDPAEMARHSAGALCRHVLAVLRRVGWQGAYPLIVTAWEQPVLTSPSVHLWIPHRQHGGPLVEGIFEQILAGPAGTFVGAGPSGLPQGWRQRIADEAARLGTLFQLLGYFGRCSFDAILIGQSLADARLHWIECNGRWGGVSIPMTLANRLTGDWARHPFIVAERADLDGPGQGLSEFLSRIGEDLYRPGSTDTGVVVLSPSWVEHGNGYQVMVVGRDATDAAASTRSVTDRLTVTREANDASR